MLSKSGKNLSIITILGLVILHVDVRFGSIQITIHFLSKSKVW